MRYEGPIYRPPSESRSLLIQATVGCPHNRCTFCMVYRNGPKYRERKVEEIKEDILSAREAYGDRYRTLFFPAGNTIAMKTERLAEICEVARKTFPRLERITVYGSSRFIREKGPDGLKRLADAGLSRIHVGLESGDDIVLQRIRKGCGSRGQIEAGKWVVAAGMELSLYVILGIGGQVRSRSHAVETARVINGIIPHFIRLRTFVPKVNTPLLSEVQNGGFEMLGPHGVLRETAILIDNIDATSYLTSDHYTNYIDLKGQLPGDRQELLAKIERNLERDESDFRPFFIGTE
jgi:radical SAM superfamily enzyme YgiQ (UPF0313 family)